MPVKTKKDGRDPMVGFRCPPDVLEALERAEADERARSVNPSSVSRTTLILKALTAYFSKTKYAELLKKRPG